MEDGVASDGGEKLGLGEAKDNAQPLAQLMKGVKEAGKVKGGEADKSVINAGC